MTARDIRDWSLVIGLSLLMYCVLAAGVATFIVGTLWLRLHLHGEAWLLLAVGCALALPFLVAAVAHLIFTAKKGA